MHVIEKVISKIPKAYGCYKILHANKDIFTRKLDIEKVSNKPILVLVEQNQN